MRVFLQTSLIVILFVTGGCTRKKDGTESNTASVSIGSIDKRVLNYDRMNIEIKTPAAVLNFNDQDTTALSNAKFTTGETVTISLVLTLAGKEVAKSVDEPTSRCRPLTLTLKPANNPAKVNVCPVGADGKIDSSGSNVATTSGEPSNISVEPCIVGVSDCGGTGSITPIVVNTINPTPTSNSTTRPGSSYNSASAVCRANLSDVFGEKNNCCCGPRKDSTKYCDLVGRTGARREYTLKPGYDCRSVCDQIIAAMSSTPQVYSDVCKIE